MKKIIDELKKYNLINKDNKIIDDKKSIDNYYYILTNLKDNKTTTQKRNYLFNYLLNDMIKNDEITEKQKNDVCKLFGVVVD